jgi:hypothetical protein
MNNINIQNDKPVDLVDLVDLITRLDILSKEKDKDDFIKNYAELKEQIDKTDNVLDDSSTELIYNEYSIQELFNILESNSDLLTNPKNLNLEKFKMLLDVSKNLENKLNTETMNIIESK